MHNVLAKLKKSYPNINFEEGETFCWSPKTKKVVFKTTDNSDDIAIWSLLHEVGHALLDHADYDSDFDLLQLEIAAWQKAEGLAIDQNRTINGEHIEDCLDTYRDWLHKRSLCPNCKNSSLQKDSKTYQCFNCSTIWHVSTSRMCRPYRLVKHEKRNQKLETSKK